MKRRVSLIGALAAVTVMAGYFAYRLVGGEAAIVSLPAVEDCSLHREACTATLPNGGEMRLDIEPKQPAPTDPLRVTAVFEEAAPGAVGVRLEGVNMNMGYLEHFVYQLARDRGDPAANSFSGSAGVFACSSTVMQWRVLARVELDGARYEIPFQFETREK